MSRKTKTVEVKWLGEPPTTLEPEKVVRGLFDLTPASGYDNDGVKFHRYVKRSKVNQVLAENGLGDQVLDTGIFYPTVIGLSEVIQYLVQARVGLDQSILNRCLGVYK